MKTRIDDEWKVVKTEIGEMDTNKMQQTPMFLYKQQVVGVTFNVRSLAIQLNKMDFGETKFVFVIRRV